MINRNDFERYLCNYHNCERIRLGRDFGLRHNSFSATFGNHARREVHQGEARRFLRELGFDGEEYNEICDNWGIPYN